MSNLNRRNFLRYLSHLGLSGVVVNTLFDQIVYGLIQKASAQNNQKNYNYLGIYLDGGPPRWMFDLPINVDLSGDNYNPMVLTGWNISGKNYTTYYELIDGLPPLWNDSNLAGIKSSMTIIRGMNNLSIHPAWIKQFKPRNDQISLNAILSRHHNLGKLPCVSYNMRKIDLGLPSGADSTYLKAINDVNPLQEIVAPFKSDYIKNYGIADIEIGIQKAVSKLKELGKSYNINSDNMYQMAEQARDLFYVGLGDLEDAFEDTFNDYKDSWQKAMKRVIPELDDKKVPTGEPNKWDGGKITTWEGNGYGIHYGLKSDDVYKNDLRTLYCKGSGKDFYATNDLLCAGLAISEILLKDNNITHSMVIQGGNLVATNGAVLGGDPHKVGSIQTNLLFSKYFQGIAYCLEKFKSRMRGDFNRTLVNLVSEFSRSGRADGFGSDHGGKAGVSTIFTGIRHSKKGQIVGELSDVGDDSGSTWAGHWGQYSQDNDNSGFDSRDVFNLIEDIFEVDERSRTFPENNKITGISNGDRSKKINQLKSKWKRKRR